MIKIIKLGKIKTEEKTFECENCGTVWNADEESYIYVIDCNDYIYWCTCPLCGKVCRDIKE